MRQRRDRRVAQTAVAVGVLATLVWAGRTVDHEVELAAIQDNGCSVTAGNGRVVTQPSARCPIDISLGNVLTTDAGVAGDLAAGDAAWRPLDVRNDGTSAFDRLTLSTAPGTGTLASALRLTVRRCSVAWTAAAGGYACGGMSSTLLDAASVTQRDVLLASSPAASRHGVDRLLLGLALLPEAGNGLQGATTTMTYTFTASRN